MSKLFIPQSIFLDTNVLLDAILHREGQESVDTLLALGFKRLIRICISAISIVNISYIAHKHVPLKELLKIFNIYHSYYVILPNDNLCITKAMESDNPDFEDAVQLACAESGRCVAIVTNNKKHFAPYTDTPVYTPDELLAKLRGETPTP